jgi:hypothetical protein
VSSAPEADLKPATRVTVQRTPGGRSFSKSQTHCFSPVQRPVPLPACASLQLTASGAGALGSPKLMAAWSNFATTWRIRATSPCGTRLAICSACAPTALRLSAMAAKVRVIVLVFNSFSCGSAA